MLENISPYIYNTINGQATIIKKQKLKEYNCIEVVMLPLF